MFVKTLRLLQLRWTDAETDSPCFRLSARELTIVWSEEPKLWRWHSASERGATMEEAELREVCWLEVRGSFKTKGLKNGQKYEVVFTVKMLDNAIGWEEPVTLVLGGHEVRRQERRVCLAELPKGEWEDLVAGTFVPSGAEGAEVNFGLLETYELQVKRGLRVKGVTIRPRKTAGWDS